MVSSHRAKVPWTLVGALFLLGLALRPSIIAIGPLLPAIRTDLDISFGDAGLLGTLPILGLGLFAPTGPRLAERLGPRLAMATCLGITIVFSALRALAPPAWLMIFLGPGIGAGIGMAGAILPMVVSVRAPTRPGLVTGAYATGIAVSGALAASLAVPLAGPDEDWRRALFIVAVLGVGSLIAWLRLLPADTRRLAGRAQPVRLPWRQPVAWVLIAAFGLQAVIYFAASTWLPSAYVERGWTPVAAGALVGILNGVGIVGTMVVPLFADRFGSRRSQLMVTAIAILVGALGVAVVPGLGVLWAVVLGLSLGGVFPLVLLLPVDVADRPADIGAAASLMLLGGYLLAAAGPLVLGLARDVTGSFETSLWILVGLAVLLVASVGVLSPARLRGGMKPLVEAPAG